MNKSKKNIKVNLNSFWCGIRRISLQYQAYSWLDIICIFTIGLLEAYLIVGDFQIRLALPPQDESPVVHSLFFVNPSQFNLDAYITAWSPIAIKSLINWLPAISLRYFLIQPEFFFTYFVLLQSALLGISIYILTIGVCKNRWIGWLSAIFVLMWRPHWSNLALVSGLDWMPYANWLALPILVFAFACCLRKRILWTVSLLVLGALIHPVMGGISTLIIVLYSVIKIRAVNKSLFLYIKIGILITLFFIVLYISFFYRLSSEFVDLKRLLLNAHINPLGAEYPFGLGAFVNNSIWTISLFAIAINASYKSSIDSRLLLKCAGCVTLLLCCIHFISVTSGYSPGMTAILSRSTILLNLVAVPFVVQRLYLEYLSGSLFRALGALIVIFSCSSFSLLGMALIVPYPSKFLSLKLRKKIARIAMAIACLVFSIALLRHINLCKDWIDGTFLFWMRPIVPWVLSDNRMHLFNWYLLFLCLVPLFLIKLLYKTKIKNSNYLLITILFSMLYVMTLENINISKFEISEEAKDYYLAQKWAHENTYVNSAFINVGVWPTNSWRGVSQRQTIVTFPVGGVYFSSPYAREYNLRMVNFEKEHSINSNDLRGWIGLIESDWKDFKNEFGGDFLVRKSTWPSLSFPIAYKNNSFIIYSLN